MSTEKILATNIKSLGRHHSDELVEYRLSCYVLFLIVLKRLGKLGEIVGNSDRYLPFEPMTMSSG